MKHVTLLVSILFLWTSTLYAKSITVDNTGANPADYSDLQTALDDATAGDTIFVAGSPASYGDITIQKSVILIGQGFDPNLYNANKSQLGNITLEKKSADSSNASNTVIKGFELSGIVTSSVDETTYLNNILIERNYITSSLSLYNLSSSLIRHNIISRVISGTSTSNSTTKVSINTVLSNNFIASSSGSISFYGSTLSLFNNIIFTLYFLTDNALFENNIFMRAKGYSNSYGSGRYYNNIFVADEDLGSDAISSNNQFIDDKEFVSGGTTFSMTSDYHGAEGSPILTAATDGGQVGVYGGSDPYPEGTNDNYPNSITVGGPEVEQLQILNFKVSSDGTLRVKIKAESYE